MNILFITDYEDIGNGGDSRVPWEMSRYVADNTKNKIFLLTTGKKFSIEKDISSPSLTILRVPSLKILSTYRIFMSDTFSVHYLYEILNSLNLDIIHSHSYSFLSYTVQNWCDSNNKPFIYTSHILPTKALSGKTETYINKGLKVPLNIYFTNFYKGCSSIIVLNKYAQKDWKKYSKYKYPLTIIPNANNFSFDSVEFKSVSPTKDSIRLIFTGRITKNKNQIFLIKSLPFLKTKKRIHLILPGEGIRATELEILSKALFKNTNIEVKFPGFIPHEQVKKELLKSTYFVSASLREVQSLSVIEALASGTPVIALQNETTNELIKDKYNGFLIKRDSTEKQFAKVLDKALNINDSEYITMCKNSIKSVNHLTFENVWEKTEELYKTQPKIKKKKDGNDKPIIKNLYKVFTFINSKNKTW